MSEIPPGTLEGWYVLHQVWSIDWRRLHALDAERADRIGDEVAAALAGLLEAPEGAGWSAAFQLVGGGADLMLVHFRETLDALAAVQLQLRHSTLGELLELKHDFLSVTEVGLYYATAEAARQATPGSNEFQALVDEAAAAERGSPHLAMRLFPRIPEGMRYVSFYPMSKRRTHPDNWYALPVAERSALMTEHGLTGRKYARRIYQVITGAVGLDDWEWGVTLFAHDPLDFKRIVTEMRYDEASTRFGEFGEFYTGVLLDPAGLAALLVPG
jgi:chlorite dismutase